jgi:hypothetical protein
MRGPISKSQAFFVANPYLVCGVAKREKMIYDKNKLPQIGN